MTETAPSFEVFHCPSCGKPTTASLDVCRHCRAHLRGPKAGQQAGRIFNDEGPAVKWGCFGLVVAFAIGVGSLASQCSNQRAQQEIEAAAAAKAEQQQNDATYDAAVRGGTVCADGRNGSNIDLIERVKLQLRDPNSFEHEQTTISVRSSKHKYLAVMQYRAKNGFGGYNSGAIAAVLSLTGRNDCRVEEMREVK